MNTIFFTFFIFLFNFVVSQDTPTNYYKEFIPFNTEEIETTQSTALFSVSKDLANCTCDLQLGICDYHCCCDKDCPDAVLNMWKADEVKNCIEQKINNRMKHFNCSNAENTYKYNANEAGIKYRDQISNLLCVEFDNGKDMGEYFEDISTTITGTFLTSHANYNTRNYINTGTQRRRNLQENTTTGYSPGSPIKINRNNEIFRFDIFEADSFGYCQNTSYVSFAVNIDKKSCIMNFNNAQNSQRIKQIQFFKSLTTIDNGNGISLNINFIDVNGNTSLDINNLNDNTTLEEINIEFIADNTTIIQATVRLKIIEDNPNPKSIKQKYSVIWSSTSSIEADALPKSGNPGYIVGKNLLVGKNSPDNLRFIVNKRGFTLKSGDASNCQTTTSLTTENPIKFGVNTMIKCKMNIEQATSIETIGNLIIFSDNKAELGSIGKFGCSNPQYKGDWINVNNTSFNITKEWISGNIYNVTTTAYFVVITSKFGPKNNPQNYVLSARLLTMNEVIDLTFAKEVEFKFYVKFVPASYEQLKNVK